ncbi:MAG: isoprenylcysteine carboxylmethyltransferase family protein [Acidimicrobiia bacterium]|nr:isoprenylcysteine carboxylmethyltransferase family protein [Acidimicrobiia bacterium]
MAEHVSRLTRAIARSGALLFLLALLYAAYTYEVTMGTPAVSSNVWPAAGVNVLLFSVFALHHSVFARTPVRGAIQRAAGAPLERPIYIWSASLLLVAVCLLWQPVGGDVWHVPAPWAWGLRAVQVAGVWVSLRSAAAIDLGELAGLRPPGPSPRAAPTTKSFYGWVRHPIYTGWFAMVFAEPAMTATRLVFALVSGVYLLVAIPLEERSLAASMGPAYRAYTRQVRWRLLPGLY